MGCRPPRQIPPADRRPGSELFCGAFLPIMVPAVDAVDTLRVFPDGLYCWVKYASACYLLPGQYRCICQATTSSPTGATAGAARNGAPRGGVGRDNSARRCLVCASQTQTTDIPLAAPSQHLGHLTCTSPALIIVVANVSFWPRLTGGPEGTVGHNPTRGVT